MEIIKRFWELQNDRQYTKLLDLFSDDVVFCDPIFGTMTGIAAVAEFMELMERVVPASGARFDLVDCAEGTTTAWSRWVMHTPDGTLNGQSLYCIKDGKLCFDADYFDSRAYGKMRGAEARPLQFANAGGASAGVRSVGGAAEQVVRQFWAIQGSRRYSQLTPLFAPEAVFEDVIYGRFDGRDAIGAYLDRMETEMPDQGVTFELVDVCGDDTVAWSQWNTHFARPDGSSSAVPGWTLHTVRDGLRTLDADYFDVAGARAAQARPA